MLNKKFIKACMMDVDLLRPGTVPISPDTVLWFEFLLNPDLLEKHLNKANPDPSPTDLIIKFLTISAEQNRDTEVLQVDSEMIEPTIIKINNEGTKCSRKSVALKILALKVTAFLNWDLELLENKLPLALQSELLRDMLELACEDNLETLSHSILDFNALAPHNVFAIVLYHRWVLRAIVGNALNNKQARVNNAQLFISLEEECESSADVLYKMVQLKKDLEMPTYHALHPLPEEGDAHPNWMECITIPKEQFHCELLMDLASYRFYRESYSQAKKCLIECNEIFQTLQLDEMDSELCHVTSNKLDGYCAATGLPYDHGKQTATIRFHASIKEHYEDILPLLQEDNLSPTIPSVARDCLQLDLTAGISSGKFTATRDLLLKVQTLNAVRKAIEGAPATVDLASKLNSGRKGIETLTWALKPIQATANPDTKQQLNTFLLDLMTSCNIGFANELANNIIIKQLISQKELDEVLKVNANCAITPEITFNLETKKTNVKNRQLEIGALERQLMLSNDPIHIRELIIKLSAKVPTRPIWTINSKWEVSGPLQQIIQTTIPNPFLQQFFFVLCAKARELDNKQDLVGARKLLNLVLEESTSQSVLHSMHNNMIFIKICQLVDWEILLIDIHRLHTEWPATHLDWPSLSKHCENVLKGQDMVARLEVVEQCVIALLNMSQWDAVSAHRNNLPTGLADLSAALAVTCQEITKYSGSKKVQRDAWDLILPVFGNWQPKRERSSVPTVGALAFNRLLAGLREQITLSVAISLLARLHNVLRDETSLDLVAEYVHLWPGVVSNANSYHTRSVAEVLSQLLVRALHYYPYNVSWLKLQGDLNYVTGHHSASLKCYLEAAIASSDYFSRPLTKAMIEDHVFKRMIKCCTHLQCHTQAAVLCQFLEEVDYVTAFKSLSESTCSDAMDSYYDCIWDTNILEYLIHLHTKRNEHYRKQQTIKIIGLLELNENNNDEIKREAANIRKSRFLRAMAKQYVC